MRPINSSYDTATAEFQAADTGPAMYAAVQDCNGPVSVTNQCESLSEAIDLARSMDAFAAPTELEDDIGYDGSQDGDDSRLIAAAERAGWRIVATSSADEHWTVMVEPE